MSTARPPVDLRRRRLDLLGWLAAVGLLGFVGYRWHVGLAGLPPVPTPHGGWLAASWLGLGAAMVVGCECWRLWLRAAGVSLGYLAAFRVLYRTNLAKYLPGGGWHFVGRVVLAQRVGVPALATTLTLALDVIGHVAGAVVFSLACAGASGLAPSAPILVLGGVVLIGLHPAVLNLCLQLAGKLLRREVPAVSFTYARMLGMTALYAANWVVIAAGFYMMVFAFAPSTPALPAMAAFAAAWLAGVVAPLAPAGLGVRDATLAVLLEALCPPGMGAALALLSRLWFITGELVAFLLTFPAVAAGSGQR